MGGNMTKPTNEKKSTEKNNNNTNYEKLQNWRLEEKNYVMEYDQNQDFGPERTEDCSKNLLDKNEKFRTRDKITTKSKYINKQIKVSQEESLLKDKDDEPYMFKTYFGNGRFVY